jgi:hypothetical protein
VDLDRLRARMPVFAFILLAVVCLVAFGFACACLSESPAQALERAVASASEMPAIIEVWSYVIIAAALAAIAISSPAIRPRERASPAQLQRFLF